MTDGKPAHGEPVVVPSPSSSAETAVGVGDANPEVSLVVGTDLSTWIESVMSKGLLDMKHGRLLLRVLHIISTTLYMPRSRFHMYL